MLVAEEERPGTSSSRNTDDRYEMQWKHQREQIQTMEGNERRKKVLFVLLTGYISAFFLMVTSICTSSWYTTHPLAPQEHKSYGSLGLIEHCSTTKGVCTERKGILKFSDGHWPYRPLKNQDFDTTLLILIISMSCTVTSLGLTLLLRIDSFNCKPWLKPTLLLVSLKSAILGISGVWYLDAHVASEQFRHGWSSYVAWISVGLLILVNIPVVYLIRLKPTTPSDVKLEDFGRGEGPENDYILPPKKQMSHRNTKPFHYLDIHDVE